MFGNTSYGSDMNFGATDEIEQETQLLKDVTPSSKQGTPRRWKPVLSVCLVVTLAIGVFFVGRQTASLNTEADGSLSLGAAYTDTGYDSYGGDTRDHDDWPYANFPYNNLDKSDYTLEWNVDYPSQREMNDAAQNAFASINKRLAQLQGMDLLYVQSQELRRASRHGYTLNPENSVEDPEYLWFTVVKNHWARYLLWQTLDTYILHIAGSVINGALGVIIRDCDPSTGSVLEMNVIDTLLCEIAPGTFLCPAHPSVQLPTGIPNLPTGTPNFFNGGLDGIVAAAIEIFGESICADYLYTCLMCTEGCVTSDEGNFWADINDMFDDAPSLYCERNCGDDFPDSTGPPELNRRRAAQAPRTSTSDGFYGKDGNDQIHYGKDGYDQIHYDNGKDGKDGYDHIQFRSAHQVDLDSPDAFTCLTDDIVDHLNRVANDEFSTTDIGGNNVCNPLNFGWQLGYPQYGAGRTFEELQQFTYPAYMCIRPVNGFLSLSASLTNLFGVQEECLGVVGADPYDYRDACPNWFEIGQGDALLSGALATLSCAVQTNLMLKQIKGCPLLPTDPDFNIGEAYDDYDFGVQSSKIPLDQLADTVVARIGQRLKAARLKN